MWWGNTEGKVVNKLEISGDEVLRIMDRNWNIEEVYVNDSKNAVVLSVLKKPVVESEEENEKS